MSTNPFIAAVNVGPRVSLGLWLQVYDANGITIPIFPRISNVTCGFTKISIPLNARFAAVRILINNDTQAVFSNRVPLGFENFLEYSVNVNGVISATLVRSPTFPPVQCGGVPPYPCPNPYPCPKPCRKPYPKPCPKPCSKYYYNKKCYIHFTSKC